MPAWMPTFDPLTISLVANVVFALALIVLYLVHSGALKKLKADTANLFTLHTNNATNISSVAAAPVPQEQIDLAVQKAIDARIMKVASATNFPWDKTR